MTRVFWDTMLFIYLFQNDKVFGDKVVQLRKRSQERGDELCTSHLALGEVLAGAYRDKADAIPAIRSGFMQAGIRLLPFNEAAADIFGRLRAQYRLSTQDCIHLACAAAAGTDVFVTGDAQLTKLQVPGIKFVVGLDTNLF